jgi:hypothetical protein
MSWLWGEEELRIHDREDSDEQAAAIQSLPF